MYLDRTNPVRLPSTYSMWDIPFLLNSMQYFFISHMVGSADLLYCASNKFRNCKIILVYSPECPIFITTQNYDPDVAISKFFCLKFKSILLVKKFFLMNVAFAKTVLGLMPHIQLTPILSLKL